MHGSVPDAAEKQYAADMSEREANDAQGMAAQEQQHAGTWQRTAGATEHASMARCSETTAYTRRSGAAAHRGASKLGTAAGRQHAGTRASSGQREGGNTGAARRQQRTQPASYTQKGELLTPRTFFTAALASLHAKGRGQPASPCGALSGNPQSLVFARSRSSRRWLDPAPRTHAFRYSAA